MANPQAPGAEPKSTIKVGVVILAAGFGTRIRRELDAHPQLSRLKQPKPLLQIAGKAVLSHWVDALTHPSITGITLITNAAHYPHYAAWAAKYHDRYITIISNTSTDNSNRHGAVADLNEALQRTPCDAALVLAGDTLLPGTDINEILEDRLSEDVKTPVVLAYELKDIADASRRGMLRVEKRGDGLVALGLVEKPSPENAPSRLATAPIYFLPKIMFRSVEIFLDDMKGEPLEKRDAPGHWLASVLEGTLSRWFTQRMVAVVKVSERVDIGGLNHYKDALWELGEGDRGKDEPAIGRAFPRVGLLGNPSDGYGGAVLAFTIASEGFAEVIATDSDKFRIIPNPELETSIEWNTVDGILAEVHERGLDFGARKLVVAAVAVFAEFYKKKGKGTLPNCELTYSTTIPPRIGLAGSSALVLATFRALARFCSTTLADIESDVRVWPELMRKVETKHLGIACGLMDRVVQVLQGVVYMNFSKTPWEFLELPVKLPDMWLAYSQKGEGECSGKVHGGLTKRFLDGDEAFQHTVDELAGLAKSGSETLLPSTPSRPDYSSLVVLFRENFRLRRKLIGDDKVGERNIMLVRVAEKAGFAAKMTGSGGCALCLPVGKKPCMNDARRQFAEAGFVLRKVRVLKAT